VANVEQTARSLSGIRILFTVAPATFALLSVAMMAFYPLKESMVRQIELDLAARRATTT
jgi:GPH family glycoside/pentoside/hexuronide:cation symporter